jgi:hypothetical protein
MAGLKWWGSEAMNYTPESRRSYHVRHVGQCRALFLQRPARCQFTPGLLRFQQENFPVQRFRFYPRCFSSQSSNSVLPQRNLTYLPSRIHGIRCSLGVRARVWFRIQDSGIRQRAASSTESISSVPLPLVWDIHGCSVTSKLSTLAEEFHRKIREDENRILFENRGNLNTNAVTSLVLKMKRESADEWARRAEEIYHSTWQKQGHRETGSFVRAVCARILQLIRTRASSIEAEFVRRTKPLNHAACLKDFQLHMRRLEGSWQRRLESEALDLEEAERTRRLNTLAQSGSGNPAQVPSPPRTNDTPKFPDGDPKEKIRAAAIRKVQNPHAYTILTIPEATRYFEVQPRTVHRWLDGGKLKSGARRGSVTIESILRWEKKRSRKRHAR